MIMTIMIVALTMITTVIILIVIDGKDDDSRDNPTLLMTPIFEANSFSANEATIDPRHAPPPPPVPRRASGFPEAAARRRSPCESRVAEAEALGGTSGRPSEEPGLLSGAREEVVSLVPPGVSV